MTAKREAKREDLRTRLIDAAEARIKHTGLLNLRARDVTTDAGCALGGLYTAFSDLDALVVDVNTQTLKRLDAIMSGAVANEPDPGRQMKILGATYLGFARDNPRLWRALFEHVLPEGRVLPDWHVAAQAALLTHIIKPLRNLQPDFDEQTLIIRARTLFAAVHGIVSISLENRFTGIPNETLDDELDRFIGLLLAGLRHF